MAKQVEVSGGPPHWVHLEKAGIATTQALMLVDVSNAATWPHAQGTHVVLEGLTISLRPDASFAGTIEVGFLANVDSANGNLHHLHQWDIKAASPDIHDELLSGLRVHCLAERVFGAVSTDETLFQTDVNLEGPDGLTTHPSGDGDLVLRITRTGGSVDLAVSVGYCTE